MSAQLPKGDASRKTSLINRIVAFALEQRLLIVLLSLAIAAAGVWAYEVLPMDAYPNLSPPMVEIISQWPGHSAEEVERLITVPVELGMNAIPGLVTKRSISLYGLSDVTLTFTTVPTITLRVSVCTTACPASPCRAVWRRRSRRCRRHRGWSIATCCKVPTARRWN